MSSALVSDDQQSWVCIVDDVQSDTTRLDVDSTGRFGWTTVYIAVMSPDVVVDLKLFLLFLHFLGFIN